MSDQGASRTLNRAPGPGPFIAFLVVCFAVVALAGVFASYAAPLPYERAMARLAALPVPTSPDVLEALKPRDAILTEAAQEAGAVVQRIRLLLGILTVMAGFFGCGIALIMRRQAVAALDRAPH